MKKNIFIGHRTLYRDVAHFKLKDQNVTTDVMPFWEIYNQKWRRWQLELTLTCGILVEDDLHIKESNFAMPNRNESQYSYCCYRHQRSCVYLSVHSRSLVPALVPRTWPWPQPLTDMFKLVQLGPHCTGPTPPPPPCSNLFTMKSESRRLAFNWNTLLLVWLIMFTQIQTLFAN